MKKFPYMLMLIFTIGLLGGYQKNVLLEMVTNDGCPSCPPADAEFDTIVARYDTMGVYGIKYHAWWPNSQDPFYVYNRNEARARIQYYNVHYTPHLNVNGYIDGGYQYPQWENLVLNELGDPTPINLSLNVVYDDQSATGYMITTITADAHVSHTNLKLRYVITENDLHHNSPNGERIHNHVFRDMLPDVNGVPIVIDSGQTIVDTQEFTADTLWVIPNCEFIVFLQDDNTKEILQSAMQHVTIHHPSIHLVDVSIDEQTGNNNGRAEPGETVNLIVTLTNLRYYQDAHNVVAYLSTDDTNLTVIDSVSNFGDILAGQSVSNASDPFQFQVHQNAPVHFASFNIHVVSDTYSVDIPVSVEIGFPELLVVDDDDGDRYEDFIYPYLDSLVSIYDTWDVSSEGAVSGDWLNNYTYVIWFTGNSTTNSLTSGEISALSYYLDHGGRLFITGQNIAENISNNPFLTNYLHATFVSSNYQNMFLNGVSGDPIGNGLSLVTSGPGSAMNQTSKDVILPASGAYSVITYGNYSDSVAGVRYEGSYKVVFFSFGIEGLGEIPPTYQGKRVVLARVLSWLGMNVSVDEHTPVGAELVTIKAFPNPFSDRVSFAVPEGRAKTLRIFDASGKLVAQVDLGISHSWDGRGLTGKKLPAGVYFYSFNGKILGRLIKMK